PENGRRLGPSAEAEIGLVRERFSIMRDHLPELGKPLLLRKFVLEAFLQDADREKGRCGCSGGSSQKGHQRMVGRRDQLGSELQKATAPGLRPGCSARAD